MVLQSVTGNPLLFDHNDIELKSNEMVMHRMKWPIRVERALESKVDADGDGDDDGDGDEKDDKKAEVKKAGSDKSNDDKDEDDKESRKDDVRPKEEKEEEKKDDDDDKDTKEDDSKEAPVTEKAKTDDGSDAADEKKEEKKTKGKKKVTKVDEKLDDNQSEDKEKEPEEKKSSSSEEDDSHSNPETEEEGDSESESDEDDTPVPLPLDGDTRAHNKLLLILASGFRHDYVHVKKLAAIPELIQLGVRPKYVRPAFPANGYPNWYTLATGLAPVRHGFVDDQMYDTKYKERFPGKGQMHKHWWNKAEPLWITALKHRLKVATYW